MAQANWPYQMFAWTLARLCRELWLSSSMLWSTGHISVKLGFCLHRTFMYFSGFVHIYIAA